MNLCLICSVLVALALCGAVEGAERTFAQRLGWPQGSVVVIFHVDDVGMSHDSNLGAIRAVEQGVATSWSVMMPCPWVSEIRRYLKDNSNFDNGLHLTLTSEWESYRWGPLAGKARVPGLVDEEGCLWRDVRSTASHASADEVELEIRAQIERAQLMGLPITHLDSHMGTLFARPDYFERYVKIGVEKQIPILVAGGHMTYAKLENPEAVDSLGRLARQIWDAGLPLLDDIHTASYDWKREEKSQRLVQLLGELKPGITEIITHATVPSEIFGRVSSSGPSRMGDTEMLTDEAVKRAVKERGIVVTTWKELMQRRRSQGKW